MKIDLHTPTCWKEVTAEQMRFVVEVGLQAMRREEYLLVLFCRFADIKMVASTADEDDRKVVHTRFKDCEGHDFDLDASQVADFCERLAFVYDRIPLDANWPFKWNAFLLGTTFEQWFHADAMVLRFGMDGDPERLKCAMKDLGDPRDTLEPCDITLFLAWYDTFGEWLHEKYPLVFRKAEPGEETTGNPVDSRQNIMLMLNDGKPQDNERIEKSNVHDVLAALQHKIEEAKRIEAQLKKQP